MKLFLSSIFVFLVLALAAAVFRIAGDILQFGLDDLDSAVALALTAGACGLVISIWRLRL